MRIATVNASFQNKKANHLMNQLLKTVTKKDHFQ